MSSTVLTVTLNPAVDKTIHVSGLNIGGLNRVRKTRTDPGGKGVNVAKVLNNFNVPVILTGFIGGRLGQVFLEELRKEQLNLDFVEVDGELRTNIKIVDEAHHITTELNETGFQVGEQDLFRLREKVDELLHHCSCLVLGGSLPSGVPSSIYYDFIQLAKKKAIPTVLDADGTALKEGIKAKPFAIKPNRFELEQLLGRSLETDEALVRAGKELIAEGINIVLISMGSEGALLISQHEAYKVRPFTIRPQSTVGAGDSMVAALVYGLKKQKSLQEIAAFATAAGTMTAAKPGTEVCTLQEVEKALQRVQVSRISAHFSTC
ncbi:1-phosphofructokinase [Caldalkalibacillus uzonensis]|uniref:Tagatose-6-phosphate kinase n=1 Tax=Caldalkalibacillus uzonensis TaxID=353224 RepID=A0ABU0CQY9_9BACI|nr:1-phosphofructokinase [Caldalkalibacillus uzonensis]MDQ0338789.1 1-phosphofructokinase [Caldalkalibacillus uzonensis]